MKAPLPEKLRPSIWEEFVGQSHLRSQIQTLRSAKHLPSLLLFGPPGCGKSTLALLLARSQSDSFLRLSAPEAGLAQLRRQISGIDVLVLDELHRFSKAQQDFFLPLLESGEITMIATTTENPSFSVTRQLLSRLHVLRLKPLSCSELVILAKRGAEKLGVNFADDVLEFLSASAGGDARSLLNLLEYVAALPEDQRGLVHVQQALPELVARHDKNGDSHYELASAMIKSIRGSDPDAALYYLACLLEGGEDPRFICRRLILSASEDVGLGDPQALPLAVACQQAVEFVGMPEGYIPLAETVTYLALAPKSNSSYAAYHNAVREIKNNGMQPVPLHLRNAATTLQKQWGYGKDYQYPHNFPGSWVDQEYLPETVLARHYYQSKDQGEEPRLNSWHRRHRRTAQDG
ncbi:replication-associated recombination protein A [uncultured Mailhella sp.]|uniref:replication-associated recombination protein A n=1 Tax=uncultured Mailhella sp. TaxID=1981031 RepID=UPI0026141E92|nr:replication-associated recombination protein A [uncultured Mailhella sp.]